MAKNFLNFFRHPYIESLLSLEKRKIKKIKKQIKHLSLLETILSELKANFRAETNSLTYAVVIKHLDISLQNLKIYTQFIHVRKLHNIGIFNTLQPCDCSKVIHNFSSVTLPPRIKHLLAFGLDFNLPVF